MLYLCIVNEGEKDAPQLARKIFLVHEEIWKHEGLSNPEFGNSKNFKH